MPLGDHRASGATAFEHIDYLCNVIGDRYVGTDGERRAAEYIASQLRGYGLTHVVVEEFNAPQSLIEGFELRVPGLGGRIIDCYPYGFCASTHEEGVRARLEVADPVELRSKDFDGSIVLAAQVSPLEAASRGLEGLLVADMTPWPTYHSLPPSSTREGLAPPSLSISLPDAYAIISERTLSAYMRLRQRIAEAKSVNVSAYLPGMSSEQFVVLCAHFDTVPVGGCGADNAGGVAVLLEVARCLASGRLRWGVLFLAFGAEEVGSIGAAAYAKRHEPELADCRFVMNLDGGGALLGRNFLRTTGPEQLRAFASALTERLRYPAVVSPSPGGDDTLPFNALGIPSIYHNRNHYNTHSHRDSSTLLGIEPLRRQAEYTLEFLTAVGNSEEPPFSREVPEELIQQARKALMPCIGPEGYSNPGLR